MTNSKLLLFTTFICLGNVVYGQLVQQTSNTFFNLNSIDFCDGLNGYACGGAVVKTSDGGNNWTPVSSPLFTSDIVFFEVKVFTPQKIILFGEGIFLDEAKIFLSNDGGTTWSDLSFFLFGDGLRAAHFADADTGYAVGSNGTIEKTVDGGLNWADVVNNMSYDFKGVYFISGSTGFAVGDSVVVKTTDGGINWQPATLASIQLNAISFGNSNTGYISASDGKIYKTTSTGITWTQLTSPFNSNTTIKTWDKDTIYAATNSQLTTTLNGATYWEKFTPLAQFNAIALVSSQTGYVAGGGGVIYKFSAGAGISKPVSYFTYPTTVGCQGKSISFNNQGDPSYSYQWLLNSAVVSTNYSASIIFPVSGTQYVKLVAYNGFFYDTSQVSINVVQNPPVNPFTTIVLKDTLCPFEQTQIQIPNSELGVRYSLRKGIVVSQTQNGNGNTLSFTHNPITVTTVFNIWGTRLSSCDTAQYTVYDTIYVDQMATTTDTVIATTNPVCPGDSTFIEIHSSDPGIWYRLKKDGVLLKDSVLGNGATVKLPTGILNTAATFIVTARNQTGCANQLSTSLIVAVTPISANFSVTNPLAIIGDTLIFNNTNVTGDSLFWNFGTNAVFSSDTAHDPVVTYTATGTQLIQLIATTNNGCIDTAHKEVSIYNLANSGSGHLCMGNTLPYCHYYPDPAYRVLAIHVDRHGNTYLGGFIIDATSLFGFDDMFLIKIDPAGNMLWNNNQKAVLNWDFYYRSSYITGITSDSSGNVYVTGNFSATKITMDSIVVTYTDIQPQAFVARYSPSGITQWVATARADWGYGFGGGSDILCTDNNRLFISMASIGATPKELKLPDNSIVPLADSAQIYLLELDTGGNFKNVHTIKSTLAGNPFFIAHSQYNPHPSGWTTTMVVTVSPKIKMNKNGKIFLAGSFGAGNYLGPQQLVAGSHVIDTLIRGINGYVAVLDTASGWQNAFPAFGVNSYYYYEDIMPLLTADDSDNIYIGTQFTSTSFSNSIIKYNGGITAAGNGFAMMKYNASGQLIWNKENPRIHARSFDVTPAGEILLFGEFDKFWGFNSTGTGPQGMKSSGGNDIFLGSMNYNGQLLWARNMGSADNESALFMQTDKCSGDFCFAGGIWGPSLQYDGFTFTNTNNNLFVARYSPDAVCATNPSCFGPVSNVEDLKTSPAHAMFNIYPNPNNGICILETKEKEYELTISNILGELIFCKKIQNEKSAIDLSMQPNGIYFIQLKTDHAMEVKKIIVSK